VATRGKGPLKFDFGAFNSPGWSLSTSSDAAFEAGKTEIRVQWQPTRQTYSSRNCAKPPSVLAVSSLPFCRHGRMRALVDRRLEAFKRQLTEAWDAKKRRPMCWLLRPEVFLGAVAAHPKRLDGAVLPGEQVNAMSKQRHLLPDRPDCC